MFLKLGALGDLGRVECLEQATSWSQVRAAVGLGSPAHGATCVTSAEGRVALDSERPARRPAPRQTAPLRRGVQAGPRAAGATCPGRVYSIDPQL